MKITLDTDKWEDGKTVESAVRRIKRKYPELPFPTILWACAHCMFANDYTSEDFDKDYMPGFVKSFRYDKGMDDATKGG